MTEERQAEMCKAVQEYVNKETDKQVRDLRSSWSRRRINEIRGGVRYELWVMLDRNIIPPELSSFTRREIRWFFIKDDPNHKLERALQDLIDGGLL